MYINKHIFVSLIFLDNVALVDYVHIKLGETFNCIPYYSVLACCVIKAATVALLCYNSRVCYWLFRWKKPTKVGHIKLKCYDLNHVHIT